MKRILSMLLLVLTISALAQVNSRVLVRNAGISNNQPTISVKWFTPDLLYPEGVNIYRKEGSGEWKKLTSSPYKKLSDLPKTAYDKDKDLHFFIPFINEAKKEDLKGLMFINVLTKTFQSEPFSLFLGIQYNDTSVINGKSYTYRISQIKGTTETTIGESPAITVGAETIEEPLKEITAVADTNKVKFRWRQEEQRFFAVNIYRETTDKSWQKLNTTPLMISKYKDSLGRMQYPKVYFVDDSLSPGFYTYQLAGVDFFGKETRRSESFKVEIKDLIPPPAPENLKDSVNNLDVILYWTAPKSNDVKGFNIFRSTKSSGPYTKLNTNLLPLITIQYKDKVEKAGPYYYYVSSVDAAGNEGKSQAIFSEVHDIVPPIKPTGLTAKADTGKVVLTWQMNKEGDLLGYRIFRTINKNDKTRFVLLNAEPLKTNTFTDKLAENAKNKFLYKIIALDTSLNKSEESEVVSVQLPDVIPPVKPLLKRLTNIENTISIEWLANKDVDLKGYHIYRSKGNENFTKLKGELIPLTHSGFIDENILPATNYRYYIIAVDSAGNQSLPSNTLTGYNNYSLSKELPVKLKYREDKKDVVISWGEQKSENILGYVVFRKKEKDNQSLPLTGQIKETEYSDKEIKKGETYYYEVRAYDKAGNILKSEQIKLSIKEK